MITGIYPRNFQKSHVFLYPLLCFRKDFILHPNNTYLWSDCDLPTRSLICVYKQPEPVLWEQLEKKLKMFSENYVSHTYKDKDVIVVYDMETCAEDYDKFLESKYSKFSPLSKQIISSYYGGDDNEYIDSYLFPEKYYHVYAHILNVDEDVLREVGELCSKIDFKREELIWE